MADTKISELSAASALAGTETVPVVQSSATVRTTAQAIADLTNDATFGNTDMEILCPDADFALTITPGSDLTANRTLQIDTDDANQTVTLSGDILIGGVQSISGPGAINVTQEITLITTTGADAFTLADGTFAGQKKIIIMEVDGGNGTLTPTNLGGYTTITFDTAGDGCTLVFASSNWWVVSNQGCVLA